MPELQPVAGSTQLEAVCSLGAMVCRMLSHLTGPILNSRDQLEETLGPVRPYQLSGDPSPGLSRPRRLLRRNTAVRGSDSAWLQEAAAVIARYKAALFMKNVKSDIANEDLFQATMATWRHLKVPSAAAVLEAFLSS